MKVNDMADLIEIYDSYMDADRILKICTGSTQSSVLECREGLFGNYARLENLILRNALQGKEGYTNEENIQILANRSFSAGKRAQILLNCDE